METFIETFTLLFLLRNDVARFVSFCSSALGWTQTILGAGSVKN